MPLDVLANDLNETQNVNGQRDTPGRHRQQKSSFNRKPISNPLQAGIAAFLATKQRWTVLELHDMPKKYTRYGPLLLLGPTFPTYSTSWTAIYASLAVVEKTSLFRHIVSAFKDARLTHVAINAPISALRAGHDIDHANEIRSPAGLQPVYGDFGHSHQEGDSETLGRQDFESAFWTEAVQLQDIKQVWAPQWTMFSRGNISEKRRILQDSTARSSFPGLDETECGQPLADIDVVDFYVGIGYFAFCYISRGIARVWGWDINGWSIEGLRRGCQRNKWGCRVVRVDDNGSFYDNDSIQQILADIQRLQETADAIRCVAFWGDNKWAAKTMREVCLYAGASSEKLNVNVRHCNLGLLPSSRNSWENAVQVLNPTQGGWIHVHENVDVAAINPRRSSIVHDFEQLLAACGPTQVSWSVACDHVEEVKTYAPGVIHCVYDIKLCPAR